MKLRLLFLLLLAIGLSATAAPLKNIEVQLTQPNGEVVHCFASGDEFYNYLHDADGYTIVKGESGYYVYATRDTRGKVVPSTYVVGSVDPATVGLQPYVKISADEYYARRHEREKHIQRPQMRNGKELNHGLYNNLVVFIRFAGDSYHTTPFTTVEAMFNADDYGANSLHNYYHHTSYNQLDLWSHFFPQPDGETILSYEDIYPKQYYQPYDPVSNPMGYQDGETAEREFSLLERAINYVEDMVPYDIELDYNGDGMVDNVVFVVKGNPGAWASLLWPHRWCIYDREVPLHDLRVFDFNLQLEQGGYFNVSTLCHEMFHSLGAPDLYHYSDGIDPVGAWDLMCGTTEPPQQTSTYMKYKYGNWIEAIPMLNDPTTSNEPHTYELEAVSWEGGTRNGYMIPTSDPNQFFFIEYRDKNNIFESEIPRSGLLIYRIDTRFDGNAAWNGYDYFDEVYIFRPDGSQNQAGNLDQAYFSEESGRVSFNHSTNPHPWLNRHNGVYEWQNEIANISKTGDRMSFDYLAYGGEGSGPVLENFTANVNSIDHQVELSWNANPNADYYKVFCDGKGLSDGITDTTFVYPYSESDAGYHVFSVAYASGEMLYSAPSLAWVILGNYETVRLSLSCDSPYGTKGGEVEVTFNHPLMESQHLTIYRGTESKAEVYVPAHTEASFRWIAGFDSESQGIHITATKVNESGQEPLFDVEQPQDGILASFTASDSEIGLITPRNLTASSNADEVLLRWTVPTESNKFSVYRNGICLAPNLTGYHFIDNRLTQSGSFQYHVTNAIEPNPDLDMESQTKVVIMTFACDPPQHLQGVHHNGTQPYNELSWEAPQLIGNGMMAYDDGIFNDQMGSKNQKFGIKIDPYYLIAFEGLPLTHIEMFDCSAGTYTFKVYNGDNVVDENLLYSQSHEMTGSMTLVRFRLEEEVGFDSTLPLWIVVEPSNVEKPIPCGEYVGYDNSCMIRVGSKWRPITDYDLFHSWLLRAYTHPADFDNDLTYNVYVGTEEADDNEMSIGLQELTSTTATHITNENTRYNVTANWNGKETLFSNTVMVGPSVEVPERIDNTEAHLFPNPAKDQMTIQAPGLCQVIVMNLLGQELESMYVQNDEVVLDLRNYDPALYLLRIVTTSRTFVEPIVKE